MVAAEKLHVYSFHMNGGIGDLTDFERTSVFAELFLNVVTRYLSERGHNVTAYFDGTLETSKPLSGEELEQIKNRFGLVPGNKPAEEKGSYVC